MAEQMQWTGLNFNDLHAFTQGQVEVEHRDDGTPDLGVETRDGFKIADIGDKVRVYADGSVGLQRASKREQEKAKAAFEQAQQRHEWAGPPMREPEPKRAPTIRELINQLRDRIGRVQAIRRQRYSPLVVLDQDLREHLNGMEQHPSLDDDRP